MNKHFHDSRYYLKRAGEHAKLGVTETLEPYATRLRTLVGREPESESESGRLHSVREDLTTLEQKATDRVHGVTGSARETLSARRSHEPASDQ
ncbi:DUF7553 family protein [Natronorubrum halophilum]|uniref:DUF7553 family protein n=1 Tax=Natronorubrum halophilum TaxID=1702106 RepID=UPI0010C18948|nr:hypothetical protein [Natronorubrum halophilum]